MKLKQLLPIAVIALTPFAFTSCSDDNMDDAADNIEDAADDAGDAMEDAADEAKDAAEDMVDGK